MGYYDSVKDSVKNNGSKDEGMEKASPGKTHGDSGGFDTLKQAASETDSEEEPDDDTPIEVLEEGLEEADKASSTNSPSRDSKSGSSVQASEQVSKGVEDKLDKIIEQNARMIEILESFGS